jgi:DNA-binding MarR family transcriptional regulator
VIGGMKLSQENEAILPILLKQAVSAIDQYVNKLLKEYKIARSQYRVLFYVNKLSHPTQKQMVEALYIQGSTLTLIVNTLVKKGWLLRNEDKNDRRIKHLELTDKGCGLFEKIPNTSMVLDEIIRGTISQKSYESMTENLDKIIASIKASETDK